MKNRWLTEDERIAWVRLAHQRAADRCGLDDVGGRRAGPLANVRQQVIEALDADQARQLAEITVVMAPQRG